MLQDYFVNLVQVQTGLSWTRPIGGGMPIIFHSRLLALIGQFLTVFIRHMSTIFYSKFVNQTKV